MRTISRWRRENGGDDRRAGPRTRPRNKLSEHEEARLLTVLNAPAHRDLSPRQIIPALADQGTYIASEATAYRVLHKHDMQKQRTPERPKTHKKPQALVAAAPNQVFCWDITYLRSVIAGQFFYLYLVTDIYSRRIVSAKVQEREDDQHATAFFASIWASDGLDPSKVVLHSDNGNAMKGAILSATLDRLGVRRSYSRPRVSDDNPFVESLFGTMKGRVEYPRRPFASIADAQKWVDAFVHWYNEVHRHSALNWVTPMARHRGEDVEQLERRRETYSRARARHPERWSGAIRNCAPASEVTLNPSSSIKRTPRAA